MAGVLLLDEADVRSVLSVEQLAPALAGALVELSRGATSVPPRVAARALAPGDGPIAVLGAGVQGDAHLEAAGHLLPGRARGLWSRDGGAAAALAGRHEGTARVDTAAAAAGGARSMARSARR